MAGTKVLTKTGLINIENVEPGMEVYSKNLETEQLELKRVSKAWNRLVSDNICKIYYDGGLIECTEKHPFYVKDKGWILAGNIQEEDVLITNTDTETRIEKIEHIEGNSDNLIIVYNIEVEDNHDYFVGETPVLVHNKDWGGWSGGSN